MKNLILFLTVLCGTFNFSALATTVVAEDTAEHTITFNFGRPTADVYLCGITLTAPWDNTLGSYSNLDTMKFPNGDLINGNYFGYNTSREFTRETAPTSSTLHLGSLIYGSEIQLEYCRELKVPAENPGGTIDNLFKIQTPANWDYFTNSQIQGLVWSSCNDYASISFPLSSNTAIDYTYLTSIPFNNGEAITTDPLSCKTFVRISETASGPRPANETAGNITVGVKDVINFN